MAIINGSANGSNANRINVWIDIEETQVDYQNNKSYVTADFYTQLKSGYSSDTRDSSCPTHFYINGELVVNVSRSIDYRNDTQYHLAHWEGWVAHDGDGNAVISASGNFSISSSYVSGGSASGSIGLTDIWTGATSPTTLNDSPSPYEGTINLSWSGYVDGINNPIQSFEVHYVTNDGSGWSGENIFSTGGTAYASIDASSWPRGRLFNYYIRAITKFGDNPTSGWGTQLIKNRVPGTPSGVTTDKSIYKVGDNIIVNFTPVSPTDPDGNLSGYEFKMQDENGNDYNGGQIIGTAAAGATSVSIPTTNWTPGKRWKFLVRGYDSFGIRSAWSLASALILIGIAMKIAVAGATKNGGDHYIKINGTLKSIGEAYEVVNGTIRTLG